MKLSTLRKICGLSLQMTSERVSDGSFRNISGEQWAEGPSPIQIGEYVYVYFDKYRDKRYGAIRSKDGKMWEDVSDQIEFPSGTRHGTAFRITSEEFESIKRVEI